MVIKEICEQDQRAVVEIFMSPRVAETYMLPEFASEQEARKLFERLKTLSHTPERFVKGVFVDEQLIGIVNDVAIEGTKMEIGYALHPQYQNQGYGTKMLGMVIQMLSELGVSEVVAGAFENNIASRRIMEKNGMVLTGETEEIAYRGNVYQCVYYAKKTTN